MTTVNQILESITDEELNEAIFEMKALDDTGVLPPGQVRKLAKRLVDEVGVTSHDARSLVDRAIFRIAAYRWSEGQSAPSMLKHKFDCDGWQWQEDGEVYKLKDLSRDDLVQVACETMEALERLEALHQQAGELMASWRDGRIEPQTV